MNQMKIIGYSFATAIIASFVVLFIGLLVFGFQWTDWVEWQGRLIGIVATIAAVTGAFIGLQIALQSERRKGLMKS